MIQPHLKIDKIEKYVLLPGDPGRVEQIAKYISNPKELNFNREFRSLSGEYEGIKLSIVSTGIGCPSAAIAVEELAKIGANVLIRIGTCGGLLKEMQPGDIVIPNTAACFDGTTKEYNREIKKVEADKEIVKALIESAKKFGIRYFVGINRTHDAFYEPLENFGKLAGQGFVSSEMECSAIFLVSKLRNLKAGAILAVNTIEPPDQVMENPEIVYQLIEESRVKEGIDNAIKITLEAIRILEKQNYGKN